MVAVKTLVTTIEKSFTHQVSIEGFRCSGVHGEHHPALTVVLGSVLGTEEPEGRGSIVDGDLPASEIGRVGRR